MIFSSNEKTNTHWVGPYRKQIIDYVASSLVDQPLDTWVTVKLNVKDHFKQSKAMLHDTISVCHSF